MEFDVEIHKAKMCLIIPFYEIKIKWFEKNDDILPHVHSHGIDAFNYWPWAWTYKGAQKEADKIIDSICNPKIKTTLVSKEEKSCNKKKQGYREYV
jgi:hypothetical protein